MMDWPEESRIDIIGQNGNTGEHYPNHKINPHGAYSLYEKNGVWKESASITNKDLLNAQPK